MTRTIPGFRFVALVGAAAIASLSLAACGGDKSKAADTNEISVLSQFTANDANSKAFKAMTDKFSQQTGIKVDIETANNNDITTNYEASKLANKEKDLVALNLSAASSAWLKQGQVVDTSKYLDEWGIKDKLEPDAVKFWTQEDGIAGFPYSGFNWPVWFNMDILGKAGITTVPQTLDELIADAHALRAKNLPTMVLGGGDWPAANFVYWMGQQYMSATDAETIFKKGGFCANPNFVKGLDLMGRLRDEGVFVDNVQGFTADQMTTAYAQGKASMMPSGSWAYTQVPDNIAKATKLSGFPVVSGGQYSKPTGFHGFSNGFFLSPNGEKKIGVIEKFMKFAYAQENLQPWVADASQILAVKPDVIGAVKATNPLAVAGNALSEANTAWLHLPDTDIPTGVDFQPAATAFLGKKGQPGSQFCKALDKLYADAPK
jgi:multiple sugar transport system substrate-binding protein